MNDERPIRPMPLKEIQEGVIKRCKEIIKKGKRKGEVCGKKVRNGEVCGTHSKDKESNTFAKYTKEHWNVAEGDDFGEKSKD